MNLRKRDKKRDFVDPFRYEFNKLNYKEARVLDKLPLKLAFWRESAKLLSFCFC